MLTILILCVVVAGCRDETAQPATGDIHDPQLADVPGAAVDTGDDADRPADNDDNSSAEANDSADQRTARPPISKSDARRNLFPVPDIAEIPGYRPNDTRPRHDDAKLAGMGIHRYESTRLLLYTDIDPETARTLPAIIDRAYDALVEYFGPLPPARDGSEFQVTGYIMADRDLFQQANLLPVTLPEFAHGRHDGAEFWMDDQPYDYYRRHLMIHEATHCFMMIMPKTNAPVWYLEGMAELFGTHRIATDGTISFRTMPHAKAEFAGFGRIDTIQEAASEERLVAIPAITELQPQGFAESGGYAWSWALCEFFDAHPRYSERFREAGRNTRDGRFVQRVEEFFVDDLAEIWTEWALFTSNLEYGYAMESAAIDFQAGQPILSGQIVQAKVLSDRGWQSSGWRVVEGTEYEMTAQGQVTLADEPVEWISEPEGVSILYAGGRPLGQLLGSVRRDASPGATGHQHMLDEFAIGRSTRYRSEVTGTLYLRVNDFFSRLEDNRGTMQVELRRVDDGDADESARGR